ncbi:enoyl-CoA hydratase-related protein [Undibacterium pigrum]|uniref:Enoyl-CoA hydratase n=1 Tax=Undibacterium pigrum TaxID=401470 RepID=A0A318J4B3_9BURK|nr:enoyl-CoA hydratase-related protein [Undibacterium pigrum]PXX38748.1 enoyl-CoA hydratase [Undibacterium pigrum]
MTYQCFDFSISNKIAHLRLNRPATLNTMQPVFFRELTEILQNLQNQANARVLIISSTGKHFTAGMALDVFAGGGITLDDASAVGRANIALALKDMHHAFNLIESLRMPVITAIHGGCIGGGVDMICASDIRLASSDAFFCIQEINIGMTADLGTLQRLPKLIPEGIVHEMAYTGRRLPAQRALAVGLLNEVFDTQEAMLAAALQMATEIAEKPPVAIWGSKQAIHYARDHSTHDALQQMGWLQSGIWQSSNLMEAFMAKQQGRTTEYADLAPVSSFSEADYRLK